MYRPIFLVSLTTACTALAIAQPSTPGAIMAQGWTPAQQRSWYYTTQGSRLMPLSWFRALEQPSNVQPFLTPAYIESFGLLYDPGGVDDLPVGFAANNSDDTNLTFSKLRWIKNQGSGAKWVGLTCSACHTGQLEFGGNRIRVDGGPSLFDFQSFIEALDGALATTLNDPAKFGRFASKALGTNDNAGNRALLRGELQKLVAWEARVEAYNQTSLRYGHGRVDAFGHIFNKIALFAGTQQPIPNPADAPVSYPFLWDIYRHDKLQWNGIVKQNRLPLGGGKYLDYGALGRNTGEVLGVFGDVTIKPSGGGLIPSLSGYPSSVNVRNLDDLETQLRLLRAPRWPGTLDGNLVTAGSGLFDQHCKGCHERQPGTAQYKVKMVPLSPTNPNSTDPWMACNALSYRSPTVKLKGTRKNYVSGDRFDVEGPLADMLAATVIGSMLAQKGAIIQQIGKIIVSPPPAPPPAITGLTVGEDRLNTCYTLNSTLPADGKLMVYKARPLDGIWATAPYLHNGSVPTLYDLLKPPAQRPSQFFVGTRVYDPVHVGYRADAGAPGNVFRFQARDAQGIPISRNSNAGHDYGVGALTEPERLALLEYLKSL